MSEKIICTLMIFTKHIKKKKVVNIIVGTFYLTFSFLIIKWISNSQYTKELPLLPDFNNVPAPAQEQVISASKKAQKNPTSDNLGTLGMVYHSGAYYDQAAQCYRLAIKKNKRKWE